MRDTERAQLCDLPHVTLGLKEDSVSVCSSQDHPASSLELLDFVH